MKLNEIEDIVDKIKQGNKRIIGICGVPGAGKSTLSKLLAQKLPQAAVISMDGYHIYRKDLDQQGVRRRGAPFTFDFKKFEKQILRLKCTSTNYPIYFPSFDHKEKDPKQQTVKISKENKFIIVEGLYIFDKSIGLDDEFWDTKIWVEVQDKISIDRLAKRHFESGIVQNLDEGIKRATENDLINGHYVKSNSRLQNAVKIVNQ